MAYMVRDATKQWKRGALSLLSAMIATASMVSAPLAAAAEPTTQGMAEAQAALPPPTAGEQATAVAGQAQGRREVKVYTRDEEPGGLLNATITWTPNGDGTYRGNIVGRVFDLGSDRECVKAFATGGAKWYSLGSHACPKGDSQNVKLNFKRAKTALVRVCLMKDNGPGKPLGKPGYCSKPS
jgi:hypothetical protein